jgi:putative oxidoreductase
VNEPALERLHAVVVHLARFGLAGLFLYAGALKIADAPGFAQDISHYRLLPDSLAALSAVVLPVLELVTGVGLLLRRYVQGAALLSALMLLLFAAAMAQAKLRGIDLECGCFGASSATQVSFGKVALNAGLAILSVWIAWTSRPRPLPQPAAPPSAQPT